VYRHNGAIGEASFCDLLRLKWCYICNLCHSRNAASPPILLSCQKTSCFSILIYPPGSYNPAMSEENQPLGVQLQTEPLDVEALVADVRKEVAEKRKAGVYADARIGRADRHNLMYMADSEELLRFYLGYLQEGALVDINDFRIEDRRAGWKGKGLVKLKRVIWNFLKFYTYRLWSQQNQINSLLVTAIESSFQQMEKKIETLEARIAELEKERPS